MRIEKYKCDQCEKEFERHKGGASISFADGLYPDPAEGLQKNTREIDLCHVCCVGLLQSLVNALPRKDQGAKLNSILGRTTKC